MSEKISAIVLYLVKHTDKTSILHLYSREFGRITCVVNGIFSQKSRVNRSILFPLSVINGVVNAKGELFRLREAESAMPLSALCDAADKRCIALFLAEVLSRSLREAETDEPLYDFLIASIDALANGPTSPDFHLYFLLRLSSYLGFAPNLEGLGASFDLANGWRCAHDLTNIYALDQETSDLFFQLCAQNGTLRLTRQQRQLLLDVFMQYYQLHLPSFGSIRSLDVLRELFD